MPVGLHPGRTQGQHCQQRPHPHSEHLKPSLALSKTGVTKGKPALPAVQTGQAGTCQGIAGPSTPFAAEAPQAKGLLPWDTVPLQPQWGQRRCSSARSMANSHASPFGGDDYAAAASLCCHDVSASMLESQFRNCPCSIPLTPQPNGPHPAHSAYDSPIKPCTNPWGRRSGRGARPQGGTRRTPLSEALQPQDLVASVPRSSRFPRQQRSIPTE